MEYHQSITGLPFLEAIFLDLPTLLDFLKVEDDKKFEYQKWNNEIILCDPDNRMK